MLVSNCRLICLFGRLLIQSAIQIARAYSLMSLFLRRSPREPDARVRDSFNGRTAHALADDMKLLLRYQESQ